MAEIKKAQEVPERATQAVTRPMTVPLSEFVLEPERYCHRDPAELTDRDNLEPPSASSASEALRFSSMRCERTNRVQAGSSEYLLIPPSIKP